MRAKHNVPGHARHKKILKMAKGYWGKRSKHYRRAIETVRRALVYAYRDRKVKKREFRRLWITRINAACRQAGITYSALINGLKKAKVNIDRKILADLAVKDSLAFQKLVEMVRK